MQRSTPGAAFGRAPPQTAAAASCHPLTGSVDGRWGRGLPGRPPCDRSHNLWDGWVTWTAANLPKTAVHGGGGGKLNLHSLPRVQTRQSRPQTIHAEERHPQQRNRLDPHVGGCGAARPLRRHPRGLCDSAGRGPALLARGAGYLGVGSTVRPRPRRAPTGAAAGERRRVPGRGVCGGDPGSADAARRPPPPAVCGRPASVAAAGRRVAARGGGGEGGWPLNGGGGRSVLCHLTHPGGTPDQLPVCAASPPTRRTERRGRRMQKTATRRDREEKHDNAAAADATPWLERGHPSREKWGGEDARRRLRQRS